MGSVDPMSKERELLEAHMTMIDGIVTGLDTTAMIEAIVSVSGVPKYQMQRQLSDLEDRRDKVAGMSTRLTDLSGILEDMADADSFVAHKASVSEEGQFSATVGTGAVTGIHEVRVETLANSELEVSEGFADQSSTGVIHEGTYSITYAGTATDITIDSSNSSLVDLAAAIDDIDGLSAYVLDTGEAVDPYKLVVQGTDTGAANTIEIAGPTPSGAGTVPTFTEQVTAADAKIHFNDIVVYSASNQVSAIPGLTLDLEATSATAVTLTVEEDLTAIEETIQGFVDAYNEVANYYEVHTVYNADNGLKGALVGDSSARRVMDRLGSMVSSQYTVDGALEALSQLGIQTQQDGSLELDTEALQEALTDSFDDVVELVTSTDGPITTMKTVIDDVFVDEDIGSLTSRSESLAGSIEELEERITDFDLYLDNMRDRLRERFTDMEVAMGEMQSTQSYLTALFADTTT